MTTSSSGSVGVAVPAYAHPMIAPDAWRRLETLDLGGGFVVLNVADGPGEVIDPSYVTVTEALLRHGSTVCGYVDSGYGLRAPELVLADAARYRDWYGVTSVFADQVASGADAVPHYRRVVEALRADGAGVVVLNPGAVPDPDIAGIGDIVVTFEGTWEQHRLQRTPPWVKRSLRPESLCHLVYSVPRRASVPRIISRAGSAGAGIVGISSDGMPNPWSMIGKWVA
jgi:hypothetical protein